MTSWSQHFVHLLSSVQGIDIPFSAQIGLSLIIDRVLVFSTMGGSHGSSTTTVSEHGGLTSWHFKLLLVPPFKVEDDLLLHAIDVVLRICDCYLGLLKLVKVVSVGTLQVLLLTVQRELLFINNDAAIWREAILIIIEASRLPRMSGTILIFLLLQPLLNTIQLLLGPINGSGQVLHSQLAILDLLTVLDNSGFELPSFIGECLILHECSLFVYGQALLLFLIIFLLLVMNSPREVSRHGFGGFPGFNYSPLSGSGVSIELPLHGIYVLLQASV